MLKSPTKDPSNMLKTYHYCKFNDLIVGISHYTSELRKALFAQELLWPGGCIKRAPRRTKNTTTSIL